MRQGWHARPLVLCLLMLGAGHARADQIKLLSPQAMKPVLEELIPAFEKSSGNKVVIDYASAATLMKRIELDEAAELAILSPRQHELLQKQGKVIAGTSTVIAKVGFGIFARAGAARPNIGSTAGLKRTLFDAASIGTGDPAKGSSSGRAFAALVERLDAVATVGPKTRLFPSGTAAIDAVANGTVELAFEVLSAAKDPGIELAVPLPAELQSYNSYAIGILAKGQRGYAARFLLALLVSDATHRVLQAKGFERP